MLQTYVDTQNSSNDFEADVLQHIPALRRAAIRFVRNDMDAEDLVQETVYRAFRFRNHFTPGSNCRAWLFRILRNQHINECRARSHRPQPISIEKLEDNYIFKQARISNRPQSPEQILLHKGLDDDLWRAVQGLRDQFRKVVILYFMHGLSYKQIAGQVKLNLGTVKSRLYRGRRMLRAELSEYSQRNSHAENYHRTV